jgi:hypothetical protein
MSLMAFATPTPSSSPWRLRRWLVRCPPSAWNDTKARLQVLQTNSPSPDVATTRPRRTLFFCAAPDESADVVHDGADSVVSDSASDTGSSSLARFIPAPMDDLIVLIISWMDRRGLFCDVVQWEEGYE